MDTRQAKRRREYLLDTVSSYNESNGILYHELLLKSICLSVIRHFALPNFFHQ